MKRDSSVGSDEKIPEADLVKYNIDGGANDGAPRKRKYPGMRKNVVKYFTEYSQNTGIHGFLYMGEENRSYLEKFCWFVSFSVSLIICLYLIYETYVKWVQSPVLVSFARSPTPVWQIPFPAVTICSETKAKQRVYNFTAAYDKMVHNRENMTDEELRKFGLSALICDNHLYNNGSEYVDYETIDYLMGIGPEFNEVFFSCKWTLANESCDNFFVPILTEDGICWTFNMLDRSEMIRNHVFLHGDYMEHNRKTEGWSLEKGYPSNASKDTFPRRAISSGAGAGLFLVLRLYEQDLDYICRGPVQGFKVLLHNPVEVPRMAVQYFRAPLNQEVVVGIKPDMMTTSESLRGYDPHLRQCFFPDERYLMFYQEYTQQNCVVECIANFTLEYCGCVAYHMPHLENTKICGSGKIHCLFEAYTGLLDLEVKAGLKSDKSPHDSVNGSTCDCLPACTSLSYNAEMSQAEFNWPKVFEAFRVNFSEMPGVQLTRLTLFFKDQQFITSERNELYGQTDFLANCGGILGLFTGFSFLSIIEILYFLSLRIMCNIKKHGPHYWSGNPDLIADDSYYHHHSAKPE